MRWLWFVVFAFLLGAGLFLWDPAWLRATQDGGAESGTPELLEQKPGGGASGTKKAEGSQEAAPKAGPGEIVHPGFGGTGRAEPKLRMGPQRAFTGPAPEGAIRFPDGTWFPPVNGVEFAPPWRSKHPFSPVVAVKRTEDGKIWFEHENGTTSSLQRVTMQHEGQPIEQDVWMVGTPVEAKAPGVATGEQGAPEQGTPARKEGEPQKEAGSQKEAEPQKEAATGKGSEPIKK